MDRELVSVPEAAEALGLSRSKTYELVSAGVLPSVTIGRARRVRVDALRRFVSGLASGDARYSPSQNERGTEHGASLSPHTERFRPA
jgi:excisionase family DNA binding protein